MQIFRDFQSLIFNRMHAFMQCGSILHFFVIFIYLSLPIYLRQICICLFCWYFAMLSNQTCINLHKLAQTCTNLHKLAQTCTKLHKLAHNCARLDNTCIFSPAPLAQFVQLCKSPAPLP